MKKVLVLGGVFAGVETAIMLQKSKLFEVTLVSERDYLFLYPVSIWLPTREINFEDTKLALADIRRKYPFRLVIDKVTGIQRQSNKVTLENGELEYDYLVVAIGSDKMRPAGIEHTHTICGSPEANLKFTVTIRSTTSCPPDSLPLSLRQKSYVKKQTQSRRLVFAD